MIVGCVYQFHDYEVRVLRVNTDLLDKTHKFESDFKAALESNEDVVILNGPDYDDDWGDIDKACANHKIIDKVCYIHVLFDA